MEPQPLAEVSVALSEEKLLSMEMSRVGENKVRLRQGHLNTHTHIYLPCVSRGPPHDRG
jgi:hypothetical protein